MEITFEEVRINDILWDITCESVADYEVLEKILVNSEVKDEVRIGAIMTANPLLPTTHPFQFQLSIDKEFVPDTWKLMTEKGFLNVETVPLNLLTGYTDG